MSPWKRSLAWLLGLVLAGGLAACGGGGGGPAGQLPGATPDGRNGTYQMYAADAQLYALTLDFNARTWRVLGNGVDSSGSFSASGSEFTFDPTGVVPARNNARFTAGSDTVTGAFRFAQGLVPFVAARTFITTIDGAAGAYKFLTRTVDPAAGPGNFIFTGEIVAPNTWRLCNDNVLFTIATCPAASVITGTVTVAADQFTASVPGGSYTFRVARVGNDRLLLRASASTGTSRRFWVGVDQAAPFADGSFTGVNTAQQAASTTVAGGTLTSTFLGEGNTPSGRTGGVATAGVPGLLDITTVADGNFFAVRTADLGFVFAARDNPVLPGYAEIGRR
jgi:hypothetical protein